MITPGNLESATLFTPGRASFLDEHGVLQLSEASQRRGLVAAATFDAEFNDVALFSGGYPGLAQNWDPSQTPPAHRREATLMALALKTRLLEEGLSDEQVEQTVLTQGQSSNSFGDVIVSVEKGLLDPNRFNTADNHGIQLVTGALHGKRFSMILSKALDLDPAKIQRVQMNDIYGTPESPLRPSESKPIAIAKEIAAIGLTTLVLRDTRSGDLDDLKAAEARFIDIYKKYIAK